jgi:hypothetical protein
MPPARIRQSREDRQQPWPKLFCIVHPRSISRHNENRKALKTQRVHGVIFMRDQPPGRRSRTQSIEAGYCPHQAGGAVISGVS